MAPSVRFASISCRLLLVTTFVAVLTLDSASSQKNEANTPKYDLKTEAKMKGIVEELKLPAKASEKEAAHLLVKNGTDTVDVYLCQKSFLDDMGVTSKKARKSLSPDRKSSRTQRILSLPGKS